MEKTLVILIGNARGGEETWNTMYKNLLEPYNADLALCFGYVENKDSSLYDKSKYIWEIPEYNNWREYYDGVFNKGWDTIFDNQKKTGIMGGIDGTIGSGSIIFAFRDYILKNKKDILNIYDRIILSRSDFYYIDKHPILPLGKLYHIEGEEYGGISDRHFVFDSDMSEDVLGICDFLCDEKNLNILSSYPKNTINPERALLIFFNHNNISNKLESFRRVQFTVAVDGDQTRWCKPTGFIPNSNTIRHKYHSEYYDAIKNLQNK